MNEVGAMRMDEARRHAAQLMQIRPDFSASYVPQIFSNSIFEDTRLDGRHLARSGRS
jgi:hypothetical protein